MREQFLHADANSDGYVTRAKSTRRLSCPACLNCQRTIWSLADLNDDSRVDLRPFAVFGGAFIYAADAAPDVHLLTKHSEIQGGETALLFSLDDCEWQPSSSMHSILFRGKTFIVQKARPSALQCCATASAAVTVAGLIAGVGHLWNLCCARRWWPAH